MLKNRIFLVLFISFFWISSVRAEIYLSSEQLVSPSTANRFYEIAYELVNSESISKSEAEQAIAFLTAAVNLNPTVNVHPLLLKLASQYPGRDYANLIGYSMASYLGKSVDLEPVQSAVQNMLQRANFREQREQLLEDLLANSGGKNAYFESELNTMLGLLMMEKTDNEAAKSYFIQALNKNKYNRLALDKMVEIAPEQIKPEVYLEHLRLALGENLFDLEAALAFAQYAEQLQLYQTAADAYAYSADLFGYLYPSEQLPSSIYLPWIISNYNTRRSQYKCLKIASQVRQSGRYDLSAEAIAFKAAEKIGHKEQANKILQVLDEKIDNQPWVYTPDEAEGIDSLSLAWFYCFASPDANKALAWANRAYSAQRDSEMAGAILAYALVANDQIEWAKPLIANNENQIANLALAQIQLSENQWDLAVENLKSAIDKDPGSLEAERAREILTENDGEYTPFIDPNAVLVKLIGAFGQDLVPEFMSPDKVISVYLKARGVEFSYGNGFGANVTIENNSSEPLVISDYGFLTGNIRVDARITGDLEKDIPDLVSMRIKPSLPIKPGQSIFIPLHLFTGELRRMLVTYPQASVQIAFTLYLDPVIDDEGIITNRIRDLQPTTLTIRRPGVELTGKYLENRLASMAGRGLQSQQVQTAQLFIGLLMEQHAMAGHGPLYKFMYADWMPHSLKSAVIQNLKDRDWVVKTNTMADMTLLPLDYNLIRALSANLNDTHWPVRLMAVYLMAKNQSDNFAKVLDWTAERDSNDFVRNMAIALGGEVDKTDDYQPLNWPTPEASKEQLPSITYSW